MLEGPDLILMEKELFEFSEILGISVLQGAMCRPSGEYMGRTYSPAIDVFMTSLLMTSLSPLPWPHPAVL